MALARVRARDGELPAKTGRARWRLPRDGMGISEKYDVASAWHRQAGIIGHEGPWKDDGISGNETGGVATRLGAYLRLVSLNRRSVRIKKSVQENWR
jgi:hypothetical protein